MHFFQFYMHAEHLYFFLMVCCLVMVLFVKKHFEIIVYVSGYGFNSPTSVTYHGYPRERERVKIEQKWPSLSQVMAKGNIQAVVLE